VTNPDWTELQDLWRGGGLEQRSHRHRLNAWRTLAIETLFAVASVGFGTQWAFRSGQRWVVVWLLTVVVLFAMALAYSIWSRRDALWPSSAAPLDFLEQTERRCLRRLEMLRVMSQFGAAEVVISLFLFWLASSLVRGLVAMSFVVILGTPWLWWARRQSERELEGVARLRRELNRDAEGPQAGHA